MASWFDVSNLEPKILHLSPLITTQLWPNSFVRSDRVLIAGLFFPSEKLDSEYRSTSAKILYAPLLFIHLIFFGSTRIPKWMLMCLTSAFLSTTGAIFLNHRLFKEGGNWRGSTLHLNKECFLFWNNYVLACLADPLFCRISPETHVEQ